MLVWGSYYMDYDGRGVFGVYKKIFNYFNRRIIDKVVGFFDE